MVSTNDVICTNEPTYPILIDPPETFDKTAVIDFSVPRFGLEEHLLNLVIFREKENLENERQRCQ
jgi:hypothetical protein